MKTFLLILSAIGVVLLVLALYVFTAAARHFVGAGESSYRGRTGRPMKPDRRAGERRRGVDRRRAGVLTAFPLVDCYGVLVEEDRRRHERRAGSERRH